MPATDLNDPSSGAAPYHKRRLVFAVGFADSAGVIATLEGPVAHAAGDAVVTGVRGEQWPVPRAAFEEKYDALAPCLMGQDGNYQSRPGLVRALVLRQETTLTLAGGSRLHGRPGDWLVQYGGGDQAIVAADIFAQTYRAAHDGAPLMLGLAGELTESAVTLLGQLAALLPNTSVVVLSAGAGDQLALHTLSCTAGQARALPGLPIMVPPLAGVPAVLLQRQAAWLLRHCALVLRNGDGEVGWEEALAQFEFGLPYWSPASHAPASAGEVRDLFGLAQPAPVLDRIAFQALLRRLDQNAAILQRDPLRRISRWAMMARLLPNPAQLARAVLRRHRHDAGADSDAVAPLFNQLRELDIFNAEWRLEAISGAGKRSLLERLHEGADGLASRYQDRWQGLMFATTKWIAAGAADYSQPRAWWERPLSLASLGLSAALSFAAYTELAGGCEAGDSLAWLGCATPAWRHWAGPLFLAIYLLSLLIALWRYSDAKRGEFERKHQDYRLLAECLRVQLMWSSTDIGGLVGDALPRNAAPVSSWVLSALRAIGVLCGESDAMGAAAPAQVHTDFVREQIRYHEETLLRRRETAAAYLDARSRLGLLVFVLSMLTIVVNTAAETWWHVGIEGVGHHLLVLLTLGALAYWAGNKKILENFGIESEIRRGKVVLAALRHAEQSLLEAHAIAAPLARQRDILAGVGRVFVTDQAHWHTLHRERPIEAVTGG